MLIISAYCFPLQLVKLVLFIFLLDSFSIDPVLHTEIALLKIFPLFTLSACYIISVSQLVHDMPLLPDFLILRYLPTVLCFFFLLQMLSWSLTYLTLLESSVSFIFSSLHFQIWSLYGFSLHFLSFLTSEFLLPQRSFLAITFKTCCTVSIKISSRIFQPCVLVCFLLQQQTS